MNYLVGTVIFNCLASPHHTGMGMGLGSAVINEENGTFQFDTNYSNSINNSTNITDSETESGNSFNMAMGFGASFGILGFIISVLALREKKNREYNNNNEIYLEPVSEIETKNNDSHVLVVNENYNYEEGDGEHQYETICDTLYELAGEKTVH
tara:strand:- start:1395 stop:1853 length:459 start_codon:yes stop_codon:yes gene_type:complete